MMEETVSLLKKSKMVVPVLVHPVDPWDDYPDIPNTYDKPKLCKIADPDCEACQ